MKPDPIALASAPQTPLRPFVALQHSDFRWMWLGELVSQAGSQMQLVAINWHVYALTGSAVALGLTGLARVIPLVIFAMIGGVIADAHDRKRVLFVTQSSMMIFAAILGLLTSMGWISLILIYLLAGCTAAAVALDTPARKAVTPNIVPKEHFTNAVSLNNIMNQTASIVGPALGGFIIAWLGISAVYWINAVSFLALLGALLLIKQPLQKQVTAGGVSFKAFWEGVRYMRHSGIILSTMLVDFGATFFSSANALLPIFAKDILKVGAEGLGLLYAAQSSGAVVAGLGMSLLGNVKRQGVIMLAAIAVYGAATAFYGASTQFALSLLMLALVGAGDTVSTIIRNTIRQVRTPDHMRGRMSGVGSIFISGGPQLGNVEAGLLAAAVGAPLSVMLGGIATILMVAGVWWKSKDIREYQDG